MINNTAVNDMVSLIFDELSIASIYATAIVLIGDVF
jgi:hypothetical protein